jgi:hypothetical protein
VEEGAGEGDVLTTGGGGAEAHGDEVVVVAGEAEEGFVEVGGCFDVGFEAGVAGEVGEEFVVEAAGVAVAEVVVGEVVVDADVDDASFFDAFLREGGWRRG